MVLDLTDTLESPEDCAHVRMSDGDDRLALCVGREVLVIHLEEIPAEPHRLCGHKEGVQACSFVPNRERLLVSLGQEGTAKVWDIVKRQVLASVLLPHDSLSNVCLDASGECLVFSSARMVVPYVMDFAKGVTLRSGIRAIELGNVVGMLCASDIKGGEIVQDVGRGEEEDECILYVEFLDEDNSTLVVATQKAVFLLNLASQACQPVCRTSLGLAAGFAMQIEQESLLCFRGAPFNASLAVDFVSFPQTRPPLELSVFPSSEPAANSPLYQGVKAKECTRTPQKSRDQSKNVRRVRSSGYGQSPVLRMFSGTSGKAKQPRRERQSAGRQRKNMRAVVKEYPSSCEEISTRQEVEALRKAHKGGILSMCYASDGSVLSSGSSDRTARILKGPLTRYNGQGVDLEHDSAVTKVAMSHTKLHYATPTCTTQAFAALTTTSTGRTALWSTQSAFKLVSVAESKVLQASFFYLDKLILTSTEKHIALHDYSLPTNFSPLQTKAERVKCVKQWDMDGRVSSVAAMNCFLSHILLASVGANVRCIDAGHDRIHVITQRNPAKKPIHSLALPDMSMHAAISPTAFNVFLTASTEGGGEIELWDLRSQRRANRFTGHCNRAHPIQPSLSPCLRFIATGSEDNTAYIFDTRTAGITAALKHAETVSSVAFHPLAPMLVCGDLGGDISLFRETR